MVFGYAIFFCFLRSIGSIALLGLDDMIWVHPEFKEMFHSKQTAGGSTGVWGSKGCFD